MTYLHTQRSPLYLILIATAVATAFIAGWMFAHAMIAVGILLAISTVLEALAALSLKDLTVQDAGDHLNVRFGPLPIFRKRIAYATIRRAEPARSSLIDGWGIHYRPRLGWIWNLWGFDCVKLTLDTRTFRIGTDDAAGLAGFLQARLKAD